MPLERLEVTDPSDHKPGIIYTFYSYKGGVGRSMALANLAELFYNAGLRVLMVDWDLEAPGLERYFPSVHRQQALEAPGVIDMLVHYKEQMTQSIKPEDPLEFELPERYAIDIYAEVKKPGKLYLLTAGQRSVDNMSSYAQTVLNFDWQEFYKEWEGEL